MGLSYRKVDRKDYVKLFVFFSVGGTLGRTFEMLTFFGIVVSVLRIYPKEIIQGRSTNICHDII